MNHSKRFVIINASPRQSNETTSAFLSELAEKKLKAEGVDMERTVVIKSLQTETQTAFNAMRDADCLLFIFPLYIFCLPGLLIRFLQGYAAYQAQHPGTGTQRVYAIVNYGFPEPEINLEAIRVIASFSRHIGAEFGFGVGIGGGPMIAQTKDAPFMKPLFNGFEEAIIRMAKGESGDNAMLSPRVPRWLYYMMGNMGWGQMAKKSKLKKKDLYLMPYV